MYTKKTKLENLLPTVVNFLNKKYIRFVFYLVLLFFVVFAIFQLFSINKESENDFYYYLFSSIIQGFLALIGVLGASFIYKLQLIENNLMSVRDLSVTWIRQSINSSYDEVSWTVVKMEIDSRLKKDVNNLRLKDLAHRFSEYSEQLNLFRIDMMLFFKASLFNIGFAILSLPISTSLVDNNEYTIPSILAVLSIIFSLYLLYISFKTIKGVVSDIKRK